MSTESNNTATTTSTTATDLQSYQQFALEQQAKNNAWSAEQAQKQMDFQREMSNTAHQREVADLKAAGLNPVLSANSGASVPNGASGDTDTSAAANVGGILQQVLQAQSAREVAGMYNAATMAAAQIAANASMYGSDMAYWNTQDHPRSVDEALAYFLGQSFFGSHAPGTGSSPHDNNGNSTGNPQNKAYSGGNASGIVNLTAKAPILQAIREGTFLGELKKNPITSFVNSSSRSNWTNQYTRYQKMVNMLPNRTKIHFMTFLKKNGFSSLSAAMRKPSDFVRLFSSFMRTASSQVSLK